MVGNIIEAGALAVTTFAAAASCYATLQLAKTARAQMAQSELDRQDRWRPAITFKARNFDREHLIVTICNHGFGVAIDLQLIVIASVEEVKGDFPFTTHRGVLGLGEELTAVFKFEPIDEAIAAWSAQSEIHQQELLDIRCQYTDGLGTQRFAICKATYFTEMRDDDYVRITDIRMGILSEPMG